MKKNIALAFLLSLSLNVWAIDLGMSSNARTNVRANASDCATAFVSTNAQIDDSVGIPFQINSPESFKEQVEVAITKYGLEAFRDGTFFIRGIPMHREKEVKSQYNTLLNELGLKGVNAKIKVWSVPSNLIEEGSVSLARSALQKLKYFAPSLDKDFQKPQLGEVFNGLGVTVAIEAPNVYFLLSTMEPLNAWTTVTSHAMIIGGLTVFTKTVNNWLQRTNYPGEQQTKKNVELFFKQMLLSLPFAASYSIFGHFSEILNFYSANGWVSTLAAFPNELASFVTTQGLTLAIQTLFYSQVITNGFGKWVDNQVGEEKTKWARTLRPLLQGPVLVADAIFFAMAASNWGEPILTLGPSEINWGHVGIIALTGAGVAVFNREKIAQGFKSFVYFVRLYAADPFWKLPSKDKNKDEGN